MEITLNVSEFTLRQPCEIKARPLLQSSPVECSFRIPLGKYFTGLAEHEIVTLAA